jgi:hypothetical protein
MAVYTVKTNSWIDGMGGFRRIAKDSSGNLHCVYVRSDGSGWRQVYHAKSTDGGQNWTETKVSNNTNSIANIFYAQIAIDSNDYIHIIWNHSAELDHHIYYRKYTTSWESIEELWGNGSSYWRFSPKLIIDNNDIVYVFCSMNWGDSSHKIYAKKYTTSWVNITESNSCTGSLGNIDVVLDSDNNFHILSIGNYASSSYINYLKYTTSFSSVSTVDYSTDYYRIQNIQAVIDSDDKIHLFWNAKHAGSTTYNQIRYKLSNSGATSWGTTQNLTSESYDQFSPTSTIDTSGNIHLMWYGKHAGSTTYNQIRYLEYTTSWSSISELTSSSSANQINVSLMRDEIGGYIYVWQDGSDLKINNNEIVVVAPTVTTQSATNIATTSITGNGNITATGGENCTRRGFCYKAGTSGDPTTSDSVAYDDGSFGTGAFTKTITGLTAGTDYRVRAYAVNSAGTGYGTTVDVTTLKAFKPRTMWF